MRKFAEAKILGNRFHFLSARIRLAQSYAEAGFHEQAKRHLEIVAKENVYWRAQAAKVQIFIPGEDTVELSKIITSVFGG